MTTQERYLRWCEKVADKQLKEQLNSLKGEQMDNAFFKELSFGTGGLRGTLGVGTNCMNIYMVDKATQGICNVLVNKGAKKVVICYDSRHNSHLFARNTAQVFVANGINVYITDDIMPISFLSYCIRKLSADAGIMITASHNPSIYNGYKVYESSGCQCTDNSAKMYAQSIEKVDEFAVAHADYDVAVAQGKIKYIPQELYYQYKQAVFSLDFYPLQGLNVVYSPLYGAGYKIVPEVLVNKGATVNIVTEQSRPNGDFPTCPFPNPEKREALALALADAKKLNAPLLLATDPDCDRVGIAVLHEGQYVCLSGNEVGALLTDFVLQRKQTPSIIYKTIVTSDLGAKIALSYGAKVKEVLTGFKYIGEQIGLLEQENLLDIDTLSASWKTTDVTIDLTADGAMSAVATASGGQTYIYSAADWRGYSRFSITYNAPVGQTFSVTFNCGGKYSYHTFTGDGTKKTESITFAQLESASNFTGKVDYVIIKPSQDNPVLVYDVKLWVE